MHSGDSPIAANNNNAAMRDEMENLEKRQLLDHFDRGTNKPCRTLVLDYQVGPVFGTEKKKSTQGHTGEYRSQSHEHTTTPQPPKTRGRNSRKTRNRHGAVS